MIPHHLPLYKWWVFPPVDASQMGGPLPGLFRRTVDAVQPVAEVFSRNCGNYESRELKDWIRPAENFGFDLLHTFWLDALKEGVRAGALCGSDNHKFPLGHPSYTSLTAVTAPEPTREGIFRAIQKRHTYGTSGPRVYIAFSIGESKMGDIGKIKFFEPPPLLDVAEESPLPIDFIEIVKVTPGHAEIPHIEPIDGKRDAAFAWMDPDHDPSRWVCYYLRVHLDGDAHGAWTSPIWLEPFLQEISISEKYRSRNNSSTSCYPKVTRSGGIIPGSFFPFRVHFFLSRRSPRRSRSSRWRRWAR